MSEPGPVERALSDPESESLGVLLDGELSEERARRMWRGIERRDETRRTPFWAGAVAAASAFAVVVVAWFWLSKEPPQALELRSGELPSLLETASEARALAFADGSDILLDPGARLEVLRNDDQSFVTALRRGSGTFEVRPGGPRRWIVEAGLATVEVVGTRFSVERAPSSVKVLVSRGSVRVRADTLPGGATLLRAGQSVTIDALAEARPAAVQGAVPSLQSAPEDPQPIEARVAPGAPSGKAPESDPIDALLAAADAARRGGDGPAAIRYLEQIVAEAPRNDPRRGMAALSLARLTMAADPARASRILDESMADMPRGLVEDALARRVEAAARAGNSSEASRLGAEYLQRFPNGHRAHDVRHWSKP